MSTKNVFCVMMGNLTSMNETLSLIAESLNGLLALLSALPTEEDLTDIQIEMEAQQAEIESIKLQIQDILDRIKKKK